MQILLDLNSATSIFRSKCSYDYRHWQKSIFFEPSLENSAKFDPGLISLDLATVIPFESKVVSLVLNTQPVGTDLCIYVPPKQGAPVILPGSGFPFCRLLRLAVLQWNYFNPNPHGV
jgi:hypothetical protein